MCTQARHATGAFGITANADAALNFGSSRGFFSRCPRHLFLDVSTDAALSLFASFLGSVQRMSCASAARGEIPRTAPSTASAAFEFAFFRRALRAPERTGVGISLQGRAPPGDGDGQAL